MTVKTSIKTGPFTIPRYNHNETQATERRRGLTVKTGVKAGGMRFNHNESQVRDAA